jgi:hypothetical protein
MELGVSGCVGRVLAQAHEQPGRLLHEFAARPWFPGRCLLHGRARGEEALMPSEGDQECD